MNFGNVFLKIIENKKTPYLILIPFSIFLLSPIILMLFTSFKGYEEIFKYPPTIFPQNPTLDIYIRVIKSEAILGLRNSSIMAIGTTFFVLLASIFSAYGLSKFKFRGRDKILIFILITRIIPPISLLVPYYLLMNSLGLINTYIGMIILYSYLSYPLIVWLLKSFFDEFPQDLIDSALIDGCSRTGALFRVVLPLSATAIAAAAIITFLWTWNEFLYAIVFTNSYDTHPVTVAIFLFVGDYIIEWNCMSAVGIFASLPTIFFFIFAQKYIVEGLTKGALKF
ncbi:MAG: carbohydrate ABC transporter permease [Candidatus Methanomethylicaceae archaeon]